LDSDNNVDVATIMTAIVTIGGGGSHTCVETPVEPATWGKIKSLYHH
jgi:hypothetical protein